MPLLFVPIALAEALGTFGEVPLHRCRWDFSDTHASSYPEGSTNTLISLEGDSSTSSWPHALL